MIRVRAFAKINYGLSVGGVRDDGYHEVETVMQSISLYDDVEVEESGSGFDLAVEPEQADVGPLEKNTAYAAWRLLCQEAGRELPIRVRLFKKIPSGAGLGGASADAAAVLVGVNELFGLGLSAGRLREIGVRIGADVPFCISGGTALGEGIGEKLTPLPAPPEHALLVVKPESGAETAKIYKAYDDDPVKLVSAKPLVDSLRSGSVEEFAAALGNDLSHTTEKFVLEVAEHKETLLGIGALGVCMSGTGTAVYGVFRSEEEARVAATRVTAPFVGVYLPVTCGTEILGREKADD